MAVSNVYAQIAGANVQVIDNAASVQRVNSPITTLVASATAALYNAYQLITNSVPQTLVLPASPCWTIYVRNISSSAYLSLVLTPNGGGAWTSPFVIAPSGIFLSIVNYTSNPTVGGFTAATLQASTTGVYAEVLLAA